MELSQARRELKALGYKIKMERFSWGPHASIMCGGSRWGSIEMTGVNAGDRWAKLKDWLKGIGEVRKDGEWVYGFNNKG